MKVYSEKDRAGFDHLGALIGRIDRGIDDGTVALGRHAGGKSHTEEVCDFLAVFESRRLVSGELSKRELAALLVDQYERMLHKAPSDLREELSDLHEEFLGDCQRGPRCLKR
jgi:hypothetical protein